jgi:hypothetical protein
MYITIVNHVLYIYIRGVQVGRLLTGTRRGI